MTKKERLFYLVNSYIKNEYTPTDFCDLVVETFYSNIFANDLLPNQKEEFQKLCDVCERFSAHEEDHINCPNAFFTIDDLNNTVIKTREILKINL